MNSRIRHHRRRAPRVAVAVVPRRAVGDLSSPAALWRSAAIALALGAAASLFGLVLARGGG